jgi:hypothetical protein
MHSTRPWRLTASSLILVATLCGCTAVADTGTSPVPLKGGTVSLALAPVSQKPFRFCAAKIAADRAAKKAAAEKAKAARARALALRTPSPRTHRSSHGRGNYALPSRAHPGTLPKFSTVPY